MENIIYDGILTGKKLEFIEKIRQYGVIINKLLRTMIKKILKIVLLFSFSVLFAGRLYSQFPQLDQFISDTLYIPMEFDSLMNDFENFNKIRDTRRNDANVLGIEQTKKYKYIPVDQIIAFNHPIINYLNYKLLQDSVEFKDSLIIENLSLWFDAKPIFYKSRILNGYSYIKDKDGKKIAEKQWEFRLKKKKKQKDEDIIAILMKDWTESHFKWLSNYSVSKISPYKYGRQLLSWADIILLPDGYILNGHMNLDYPKDQMRSWILGSAGLYYRKSSFHESIAVGGKDQQWMKRLSPTLLMRLNTTLRIGVNSYNRDIFDFIDFWNVMMVNIGMTGAFEYRPAYYKGLIFSLGLHQNINILPYLPDHLSIWEPGIQFSAGFILP